MIIITALNEVKSGKDNDPAKQLSQEALEQIAFQQYAKALDHQSRGNTEYATQLYKDLLNTELLNGVKKPTEPGKTSSQLWYLKYLCYKNLASLLSRAGKLDEAIEAYSAASELDDTDVSFWHRFGQVCMQAKHFEMALYAFQKGLECNPRHWPCLDLFLTLTLAFDYTEQCLVTIYQALKLDPGYLRGLVYRRHIYTVYKHMREYMEYLNPLYKWKEEDDVPVDEEKAKMLLKEAEVIYDVYVKQQQAEKFVYMVPNVTLKKPISRLTWESVGDSLVHMHHHMTEHCISHACFIEIQLENAVKMEVCAGGNYSQEITNEAVPNNKEKKLSVIKNGKSNIEMISSGYKKSAGANDLAIHKKRHSNRIRKSARQISNKPRILKQWNCLNKSLSTCGQKGSKKKYNRIHDTLSDLSKEVSFDLDIQKMFKPNISDNEYFGTESEKYDVTDFIKRYTDTKKDIIDLLKDYLSILACKWRKNWPTGLSKIFIEANTCYSTHIDIPPFVNDDNQELFHYTRVNLLVEELLITEKLNTESADQASHKLSAIDTIEIILIVNPHIFPSNEYLDLIQRILKLKIFVHIINGSKDLALECLYQLHYEFVNV